MGWVCGTYEEEQKCLTDMVGKPQGKRDDLQDPGIDGGVILKLVFKKFDGRTRTVFIWHRTQTSGRFLWTNECQDARNAVTVSFFVWNRLHGINIT